MYANNSVIDINLVGEGFEEPQITNGGALECHTDNTTCCGGMDSILDLGGWYFPNRTIVPPRNSSRSIYITRDHMVIRLNLNRVGNLVPPIGVYQCRIPNAEGVIMTRSISLGRGGK